MPLTVAAIRNAKPKDKPYKMADAAGLYLLVQPNSAKYWRLKYRINGKEKVLALGVFPEVKLADAREKRDVARKLIADGIDPIEQKREQKRLAKIRAENSFEKIAREWHEHQKGRWADHHAARVIKSLEKEIFPLFGDQPVNEIKAPIILDAIRRIEKRGALDIASRALQRVSAVYRFAILTGRAEHNPAADFTGVLKTRKVKHRAALSQAELPEFLEKLEQYDGQTLTKLALSLVVLTFVRSNELRGAHWDEFDLDNAIWRIPAERMKMQAEHLVPLSKQTIQIIEKIQPISGRNTLVFPGSNNKRKPISENTMLYAMYRMGYRGRATVHGFRATASTILNESGFAADAIERQLAHVEQNKIRAAYHRSEYLEERKRMMQWWADYLDGLATGANVVPLRTATKAH